MGHVQVTAGPEPAAAPLSGVQAVEFGPTPGRFRCDPFACASVCCTNWPEGGGVPLSLGDVERFADAGLLYSVTGRFPSRDDARALLDGQTPAGRPETPRLMSIDGHCVHYDPKSRQCRIYDDRPVACRAFPYDISYGTAGAVAISFGPGCSLAAGSGTRQARTLRIGPKEPAVRLDELPETDRAHAAACIELANEEQRTLRALADGAPARLAGRGLERFMPPATSAGRSSPDEDDDEHPIAS